MASDDYQRVWVALNQAIRDNSVLTTDNVWPYLDRPPLERNVVGKAFSEAARTGLIVGTETFVKSTRAEAKGRRVQLWRVVDPAAGLF